MDIMEQINRLVAFLGLKNPILLPDVGVTLPKKAEDTENLAIYWTPREDVIRWFAWDAYNAHSGTCDICDYLEAIEDHLQYLALEKVKLQDAMEARQRLDTEIKRFIDVQDSKLV